MKSLISSVLIFFYINRVVSLDCFWNKECKYKYFSSKTPYEIVRGDIRDSLVKPEGCEAISVWGIMRHGKRNPGIKFAQDIREVLNCKDVIVSSYENGNSLLCAQDVENIKYWQIDKSMFDKPNEITTEGYQELTRIASRLKDALPELLVELQDDDYVFLPALGQRMKDSANAFVEGLNHKNLSIETAKNEYSIIAPYASCGKFQVEHFRNPNIYYAVTEYEETADYLRMKERVERKLSLNFTLSNNNIIALYDLCRYTWEGINNKASPWCALFSTEDLKVLEYIGDLRHYYRNGYGALKFSRVLGQLPLNDLLTKFDQAKNGQGKKAVFYFTHATMLDMILVVLGLYKDVHPLTGAYRDLNRKWRSTFTAPYVSNMIAVLYRCQKNRLEDDDYKIAFYWNEKPLLELCKEGVCSWQEFENKFKSFSNTATEFCQFKWDIID